MNSNEIKIPAPLRVDHINMSVRDLDESLAWYGKFFDFRSVESGRRNGARWAILRSGETLLCLYEHADYRPITDNYPSRHQISHFGLRISDRKDWEERVAREKLEVQYGGAVRYPHSFSWYVNDPTGHEIEVSLWDEDRIRFD